MSLFSGEAKAGPFVDMARGKEVALRPQADLAVTGRAGKFDTLIDELLPEAEAACLGLDEQ